MPCYCTEKWRCERDIGKLGEVLDCVALLKTDNTTMETNLETLSKGADTTFTPMDTEELKSAIKKLNDKNDDSINAIESSCNAQIAALKADYDYYEALDNQYHEAINSVNLGDV